MIFHLGIGMHDDDDGSDLSYGRPGFEPCPSNHDEHDAIMRRAQYLRDFPEHREKFGGRGVMVIGHNAPWMPEYL